MLERVVLFIHFELIYLGRSYKSYAQFLRKLNLHLLKFCCEKTNQPTQPPSTYKYIKGRITTIFISKGNYPSLGSVSLFSKYCHPVIEMGHLSVSILTSLVIFLMYYLLVGTVSATNTVNDNQKTQSPHAAQNYKRYHRSPMNGGNLASGSKTLMSRSKIIPIEVDLVLDDDEMYDKSKRYDDYGHMRFGKRGGEDQFDDYGHMRFGKRAGGE